MVGFYGLVNFNSIVSITYALRRMVRAFGTPGQDETATMRCISLAI